MDHESIHRDFLKSWKNKKRLNKKSKFNKLPSWKQKLKEKKRKEIATIDCLEQEYDDFDVNKVDDYGDFPLSPATKNGLEDCGFVKPTAIQKAAILPALKGSDILGAAKTGSGKTLAFLIPILECLYRHRWNSVDGPGALVISPTRELALQTFEVLCKVGRKHDFSAGLIIGGKDVQEEAERVCRTNIVVCTPGRLLQHLDSTCYFNLGNLKILVLDEADRILDLGFSETVNAILENLPTKRQTLLFSATQTKSIKDLARLSLTEPVYISVHADSKHSTPKGLEQRYLVCPLADKVNMLFSFVKHHLKTKTLVFVSSCKQVQYLFNAFCQLRPGVPIMHLHGNMQLGRRLGVYREFCRKKFALLIATDVAARGLDFPDINWVIQLDCPEDPDTYIHRVGRTARFHGTGNSLLVLLPSETAMLKELEDKKVPIEKSEVNINKLVKIDERLRSFCAKDQELREQAKRAFVAYFKAVHVMKNKSIFKIKELPSDEYALSLGLAFPPRVRFLQRWEKKMADQAKKQQALKEQSDVNKLSFHDDKLPDGETDLFLVKKVDENTLEQILPSEEVEIETEKKKRSKGKKAKLATSILRRGAVYNEKIVFDDSGNPLTGTNDCNTNNEDEDGGIDLDRAKTQMQARDIEDRKEQKMKISQKRLERKLKAKESTLNGSESGSIQVELGVEDGDSSDESDDDDSASESSDSKDSDSSDEEEISEEDSSDEEPPPKRNKATNDDEEDDVNDKQSETVEGLVPMSLQEQEDLVLRLIGK